MKINNCVTFLLFALSLNIGCVGKPPIAFTRLLASDGTPEIALALNRDFEKYSVTEKDVKALRQYTAMYHEAINSGLRAENIDQVSAMSNRICAIDSLIERFPIRNPNVILYRGHGYLPAGEDSVGAEIFDRSFISTSISEEVASRFLKGKKTPVLDIISFPVGLVPGLWVHPLSLIKDEYEVILSRGLKFRVVDIEKRKSLFSPDILVRKITFNGFVQKNLELERVLACLNVQ